MRNAWNQNFAPPSSPMRALRCCALPMRPERLVSDGKT